MTARPLIACRHCDLLQREVPLPAGGVVHCRRCGAEQYRSHPDSFERTLAFTLAAIVLFVVGNAAAFTLEALVAGVQALRLEYYELFSRIFAGEGRPFSPWSIPLATKEEES